MRICFIIPKSYPLFNPKTKANFGGAEVQLVLIGRELAKRDDLDIDFMVADYGQKKLEKWDGINVWNSFNYSDHLVKRISSFFKIFLEINADIYIQETLTQYSGLMALYCKLANKKFVYMLANDGEADKTHIIYKTKVKGLLANLVFTYSDLIITQNNYQKTCLKERSLDSVLIKPGIRIVRKTVEKGDYVLWVGRSHPIKRPKLFLRIAKSHPKINFIMICSPSRNNKQLFGDLRRESRRIHNLEFIRFVPISQMGHFFLKAKALINTSKQEGFPLTFIEAAMGRTPVISLNVNPENILTIFEFGFFCDNDLGLLNANLVKLLENEDLYLKMSNNAFQYVKHNHDIRKISAGLLKNLIARKRQMTKN